MVNNKIVLITGGSGGIGAATARILVDNGAFVALNYNNNKEGAERLVETMNGKAIAIQADISDKNQVKEMIGKIIEKWGKIDVLVNNACPRTNNNNFETTKWEEFEKFIDVVVKGSYNVTKSVVKGMVQRKSGAIINVLTSYVKGMPPKKLAPYVTAKYALEGLSKSLAAELASSGIRVNMVSPSMTKTKFVEHLPKRFLEMIAFQNPLKKLANPEEIAQVILFLASDKSSYLTGVNIPIAGGSVV